MMTEEKFIELVNKEIDGLNSPRESEELKVYLQSNAEARELSQDLLKLSTVLSRVEEVDPPHSLTSDILRAVRTSGKRSSSEPTFVRWIKELVESRTTFQYAYVFSAGLILGIALYSLVGVHPSTSGVADPSSLSGSIIINSAAYPFTEGPGYQFTVEAESVSGSIVTKRSENLAVIELDIQSAGQVEVAIQFRPETLRFKGFSQSQPATGSRSVEESSFRLTTQGNNRYILAFERLTKDPSEVAVTVVRNSTELHRQSLKIVE